MRLLLSALLVLSFGIALASADVPGRVLETRDKAAAARDKLKAATAEKDRLAAELLAAETALAEATKASDGADAAQKQAEAALAELIRDREKELQRAKEVLSGKGEAPAPRIPTATAPVSRAVPFLPKSRPVEPKPAPQEEQAAPEPAEGVDAAVSPDTALLVVTLPAEAKLYINGDATRKKGTERQFKAALGEGKTATYRLTAKVGSREVKKTVRVKAGERTAVTLGE